MPGLNVFSICGNLQTSSLPGPSFFLSIPIVIIWGILTCIIYSLLSRIPNSQPNLISLATSISDTNFTLALPANLVHVSFPRMFSHLV